MKLYKHYVAPDSAGYGARSSAPAIAPAMPSSASASEAASQRTTGGRGGGSGGITAAISRSSNVLAQVSAAFGDANGSNAFPIARTDGNRAAGSRLVARSMI